MAIPERLRKDVTPHISSPAELAKVTHDYLAARTRTNLHPGLELLKGLFETLFFLSLKSEGSNPIACTILFQPKTGKGRLRSRKPHVEISKWTANFLSPVLPFTIENLRKIAHAVDPQVACLGVYPNAKGLLVIWGIVDQFPLHMLRYTSWETGRRPLMPGAFHVTITSPGELTVRVGDRVLATLRQERLISSEVDALWHGPLSTNLNRYVKRYQAEIRRSVGLVCIEVQESGSRGPTRNTDVQTITTMNSAIFGWGLFAVCCYAFRVTATVVRCF
jgi:hypothetical protein